MRSIALALAIFLGITASSLAQTTPTAAHHASGDVALTYHWLRTNAQPGDCGCFYMNGGGVSASLDLEPRWSAVLEGSVETIAHAPDTNDSLTLTSVYLGPRYSIPQPWKKKQHSLLPFAQVLLGATHAGGGVAGTSDGVMKFSTRVGGGLDLPLAHRFALRLVQVDYNLSVFENTVNARQNNLLVATGIAYQW
jgi:outer membrane immunogenic protein